MNRKCFPLAMTLLMALAVGAGFAPRIGHAQIIALNDKETVPYALDTGLHSNTGPDESLVFTATVESPKGGTAWMRLLFEGVNLGQGSHIQLTSLRDGDIQTLDAGAMQLWSNSSAMFVGDRVELKLYVAPGDMNVGARVSGLIIGGAHALRNINAPNAPSAPDTQCGGTDDRVAFADARIGRLNNNCTAWLVSNGAVLTAGHCVDVDPDDFPGGSGPGLPDRNPEITNATIVEFDVPASSPGGVLNPSAVANQFPVDTTYLRYRFDGTGQGLGKDWAVFGLQRNTTTGAAAPSTRGFFRLRSFTEANGTTLRVSGYGTDTGTANQTLQTHTGPQTLRAAAGPNNADIRIEYQIDTMPANSGSPIVREGIGFGYAIGIHTNGGCGVDGVGGVTGANSGTSFEVTALQDAINQFPAGNNNTRYVDSDAAASRDPQTGHVLTPFSAIDEGIASVPSGGRVSIVAGSYNGPTTINKNVVLVAPVGLVVINK